MARVKKRDYNEEVAFMKQAVKMQRIQNKVLYGIDPKTASLGVFANQTSKGIGRNVTKYSNDGYELDIDKVIGAIISDLDKFEREGDATISKYSRGSKQYKRFMKGLKELKKMMRENHGDSKTRIRAIRRKMYAVCGLGNEYVRHCGRHKKAGNSTRDERLGLVGRFISHAKSVQDQFDAIEEIISGKAFLDVEKEIGKYAREGFVADMYRDIQNFRRFAAANGYGVQTPVMKSVERIEKGLEDIYRFMNADKYSDIEISERLKDVIMFSKMKQELLKGDKQGYLNMINKHGGDLEIRNMLSENKDVTKLANLSKDKIKELFKLGVDGIYKAVYKPEEYAPKSASVSREAAEEMVVSVSLANEYNKDLEDEKIKNAKPPVLEKEEKVFQRDNLIVPEPTMGFDGSVLSL